MHKIKAIKPNPSDKWYNAHIFYLKGKRFGVPLIQRYGVLNLNSSYPISSNCHSGLEIHYVLKGETTWEVEGVGKPLRVSGGCFVIIPAKKRPPRTWQQCYARISPRLAAILRDLTDATNLESAKNPKRQIRLRIRLAIV